MAERVILKGNLVLDPRIKTKIQQALAKRTVRFADILEKKIEEAANFLSEKIGSSNVGSFIKSKDGQGQLGLGVDSKGTVFRNLLRIFKTTEVEKKVNRTNPNTTIAIHFANKDELRDVSVFLWTNLSNQTQLTVNLYSLIEDGEVAGAGYSDFGISDAGYVELSTLPKKDQERLKELSRSGIGIMSKGQNSYRLDLKHRQGFRKAINTNAFKAVIRRIVKDCFREAFQNG